jgi:hypothetical protein
MEDPSVGCNGGSQGSADSRWERASWYGAAILVKG